VMTMKAGVEGAIRAAVPQIKSVVAINTSEISSTELNVVS
jgi:Fe-S cluster biogenesis protein NfuA